MSLEAAVADSWSVALVKSCKRKLPPSRSALLLPFPEGTSIGAGSDSAAWGAT